MPKYIVVFLMGIFSLWMVDLYADSALLKHPDVQNFVKELVQSDHFDRAQLQAILTEASYQPHIIESMERPYEKKNWDVYRGLFLTQERLDKGLRFWQRNQKALAQVERDYGVPAEVIVAIVGIETFYGQRQGQYRVLDALTTLAFYYPPRAEYFKKELREFLLLCREQHISAMAYKGSYAGAIGVPQFMPSSYRSFAVGYQGRQYPNLISEDRDVIASVANYFKKHGWTTKQMVVEKALVANKALHEIAMNSKFPNYPFIQLLRAGVKPEASVMYHPHEAGLLALVTDAGPEYWLAYPNFFVITQYNSSPQYALAVHLLSQSLRQHFSSHTV